MSGCEERARSRVVLEGQRSGVSRGRDDGDEDREWASGFGRVGLLSVSHQ